MYNIYIGCNGADRCTIETVLFRITTQYRVSPTEHFTKTFSTIIITDCDNVVPHM